MDDFVETYKENGKWAKLFLKSKSYKYSKLFKKGKDEYLLIDAWDNKKSYDKFREQYFEEYNLLSNKCSMFYETEEKIGEYEEVD
ncbi:MAG: hypothetical protein A3J84_06835 [Ignavibacteria bacterium RIFOXYA2_FULL_37_17]|nr:MAG: hypothetical protein A3J84_06835 [Ignavibacteria bacterium RIFOXYA2_FULL_37_17]